MAKVIAQMTIQLPRLMEAGEYRKLRFAGRQFRKESHRDNRRPAA